MIKKIYNSLKIYSNRLRTTAAFGFGGMMGDWDWNDMMGSGWGGEFFLVMSGIMMLLFWLVFILAAIALIRWLTGSLTGNAGTSNKAMDILKEKYAKGEITKEEFKAKKKDLM